MFPSPQQVQHHLRTTRRRLPTPPMEAPLCRQRHLYLPLPAVAAAVVVDLAIIPKSLGAPHRVLGCRMSPR